MMTVGRRLGCMEDCFLGEPGSVTWPEEDMVTEFGAMDLGVEPSSSGSYDLPLNPPPSPRSNKSSSFSIVAPHDVVKPKSVRPNISYLLVDMNPASPPSSELTVPSESGSESSYSTHRRYSFINVHLTLY